MSDGLHHPNILICGTGAWGTALGHILATAGCSVTLWGRNRDKIDYYRETLQHESLGDTILCDKMLWTHDLRSVLFMADIIILALPTQSLAGFLKEYLADFPQNALYVQTAKGIDIQTGQFIPQIMNHYLPKHHHILLSGPSFAQDVVQKKPTAITLASNSLDDAQKIQTLFEKTPLRPYVSQDILGVALGGAMKNILAIAAGYVIGHGWGESAKAALLTRGFQEITRFAQLFSVDKQTFFGLSCLGDLLLTANSMQSRNYRYGYELAQHHLSANQNIYTPSYTAEGYYNLQALAPMIADKQDEFPILNMLSRLLAQDITGVEILEYFFTRPTKSE